MFGKIFYQNIEIRGKNHKVKGFVYIRQAISAYSYYTNIFPFPQEIQPRTQALSTTRLEPGYEVGDFNDGSGYEIDLGEFKNNFTPNSKANTSINFI